MVKCLFMSLFEGDPRQRLEAGEALIRSVPPEWLGGFFSPGGSLHFAFDPKGYVYPRASVGDNNWDKLVG